MRMNASTFVCPIHALDKAIRRLTRQTKDERDGECPIRRGKTGLLDNQKPLFKTGLEQHSVGYRDGGEVEHNTE